MLRRNILIFQTGGLGDFILTWPFAVGLGRIYPQSRIIYVTHSQKGELARRVLRLESTDVEAGWHGLFAKDGALPPATQKMLESAQAVYSFLPVTDLWHDNIARLNPAAKRVVIDARIGADFPGHVTDQMAQQLREHPAERAALEQLVRSINDRGIGYKTAGGTDVVMHPGAGAADKCWPIDKYILLAQRLKQTGRGIRFVIGEVELDRWSKSDVERLAAAGQVRRCASLVDLLNEITTAGVFIGNDSGPSHLAGIIGVDTLALFGKTKPLQWKPLGPKVRIIEQQPLGGLEVEQVIAGL